MTQLNRPFQYDPTWGNRSVNLLKPSPPAAGGLALGGLSPPFGSQPVQALARGGLARMADKVAAAGQGRDRELLHVQREQIPAIAQALGHQGKRNPRTGVLGFDDGDGDSGGGRSASGRGGENAAHGETGNRDSGYGGGWGGGGGGGFGGGNGGWTFGRTSTPLSQDDLSSHGYTFGSFSGGTQGFEPNSFGFGFLGLTPGTVASLEGLLAGTRTVDPALGWSPTKAALDVASRLTGLPVSLAATALGYRPNDYSVLATGDGSQIGALGGLGGGGNGGTGGTGRTGGMSDSFAAPPTPAAPAPMAAPAPSRVYNAPPAGFDPYTYGQGTNGGWMFWKPAPLPTVTPAPAASALPMGGLSGGPNAWQLR